MFIKRGKYTKRRYHSSKLIIKDYQIKVQEGNFHENVETKKLFPRTRFTIDFNKNKIKGTPILKLAMVKRLQVKKNLPKIKLRQKIRQNIRQKNSSKTFVKKFVKNIRQKNRQKNRQKFVKKFR